MRRQRNRRAPVAAADPPVAEQCSAQLADLVHANSPAAKPATLTHAAWPTQPRDDAEPLTADLSRLHVTVSRVFLSKLAAARDALSHSKPEASLSDVLEAGLDLVLAKHAKSKGIVAKPRREPQASVRDGIPANVKRAVWSRDGGQCQWQLAGGGICGCTERAEFAHRVPRARGGQPTVDNLRLLCDFHNQLEARQQFGEAFMARFARGRVRGNASWTSAGEP